LSVMALILSEMMKLWKATTLFKNQLLSLITSNPCPYTLGPRT
jgi:hypothetical protein